MSTKQISSAAVHIITGELADDPVPCATRTGSTMAMFSVKVVRRVGEEYQTTRYHIKTYGWLAQACLDYLHHDRLVQVVGNHMSVWAYTDEKSGEACGILELVASSVIFLDRRNGNPLAMNVLPTDDIPFSKVPEPAVDMADLGDKQQALDFYQQALPLRYEVSDKRGEAVTLNNIGEVWSALGDKQQALGFYNQALRLHRAVSNKRGESDYSQQHWRGVVGLRG